MYFVKAEPQKFSSYNRTKILELIENFKDSGLECAKLMDWHYVSAKSGANTITQSIKHYKIAGVHAYNRKGEIYLVRTDV